MSTNFAEEWEKYRCQVVPAQAGSVQVSETRQAFYCGALVAFISIASIANSPGGSVSQAEAEWIESLMDEVRTVCEQIAERGGWKRS